MPDMSEANGEKTEITIPRPADIREELKRLDERRKHLRALLKVSQNAYGEDGTE